MNEKQNETCLMMLQKNEYEFCQNFAILFIAVVELCRGKAGGPKIWVMLIDVVEQRTSL